MVALERTVLQTFSNLKNVLTVSLRLDKHFESVSFKSVLRRMMYCFSLVLKAFSSERQSFPVNRDSIGVGKC